MVVKLLVVEGSTTIKEVTLRRARTVAGRKKGCKLRIRSELVSRIHCSLIFDGSRLRIKDLGSSNGTFVNGLSISDAVLKAGDVIQIGPVKFVVQIVGGHAAATPPAGMPSPTVKLPDGEVVFFESEDDAADGDAVEIIDADLIEDLDEAAEFVTQGGGHAPVDRGENIFVSESDDWLDAEQFLLDDETPGGAYGVADDKRDPRR